MKKSKLPKTDSIRKLAEFWDIHDLTDFQEELEEVQEPVFVGGGAIRVPLDSRQIKAVAKMAQEEGISSAHLVREWVLQKLPRRSNGRSVERSDRKLKHNSKTS